MGKILFPRIQEILQYKSLKYYILNVANFAASSIRIEGVPSAMEAFVVCMVLAVLQKLFNEFELRQLHVRPSFYLYSYFPLTRCDARKSRRMLSIFWLQAS